MEMGCMDLWQPVLLLWVWFDRKWTDLLCNLQDKCISVCDWSHYNVRHFRMILGRDLYIFLVYKPSYWGILDWLYIQDDNLADFLYNYRYKNMKVLRLCLDKLIEGHKVMVRMGWLLPVVQEQVEELKIILRNKTRLKNYLFTWYWVTSTEWISGVGLLTTTDRAMINNFTSCV